MRCPPTTIQTVSVLAEGPLMTCSWVGHERLHPRTRLELHESPYHQAASAPAETCSWSLSSWPWSARAFTSTRSHTCSPGQPGSLLSSPDQASVMQSVMLQLLQQQFMQADVQVPGTMVVQGHHGFHHTVSIGLCSNPITRGCFFSASVRAETPN